MASLYLDGINPRPRHARVFSVTGGRRVRVVLRNPHAKDGRDFRYSLTVGGEYEVLGIECDMLRLLTDDGEPVLFDPECFEVTDSSEPSFWVERFPEEAERYSYPPEWGMQGFFEKWHDNVSGVRQLFAEQLARWYPGVQKRT